MGEPDFDLATLLGPLGQRPSPALLVWAYRHGIFPMAEPICDLIDWFSPDQRGIIPLEEFHVPNNLQREIRKQPFDIRSDTAFAEIMRACAAPRADDSLTWISERLIESYTGLFEIGHAHSVEAWRDGQLVGGLYGVHIGGAFFGESMFSRPDLGGSNSSKICLVALVERMKRQGFTLLDTQYRNEHLAQFGCVEISREAYMQRLEHALSREAKWESAR